MSTQADDSTKLLGLLPKRATRLAEELSVANEVHKNADRTDQHLIEIAALQAAREALTVFLVLADRTNRDGLTEVLGRLEDRLIGKSVGSPGLSLCEQHLRWWGVAAIEVLVASKAMARVEARQFACKILKKHGISKKRLAQGGHPEGITPNTIKGWEKSAPSAREPWPNATAEQGREFADRALNHIIPALRELGSY